ncbi:hypothetical protein BDV12DRAFT_171714 [Aspergillus spectabilis]
MGLCTGFFLFPFGRQLSVIHQLFRLFVRHYDCPPYSHFSEDGPYPGDYHHDLHVFRRTILRFTKICSRTPTSFAN